MPVEVEDFEPDHGVPGQRIEVLGSGFIRGTTVMFFMDAPGTGVTVLSDEALEVTVPENARTGVVSATNMNGTGRSVKSFTVDPPGAVRIQRFDPTYGPTALHVNIYGSGFNGGQKVKFGIYESFQIRWLTDDHIIASVPLNAKPGRVKIEVITTAGVGRSLTDFTIE